MDLLFKVFAETPQPFSLVTFISSILTTLVAIGGIVIAVRTYRQNSRVQASNLLLKLEEHFNQLGSKLLFLEYAKTCYAPIAPLLTQCMADPDSLSETERQTLMDVDECIRFLFICALNAPQRLHYIDQWPWTWLGSYSQLPYAYVFYLNVLNDEKTRPELFKYVSNYFPQLRYWLGRNNNVLNAPAMRKSQQNLSN
jgi:hypothetical protein